MSFTKYEIACAQGNVFKAIQNADDEFRYHWVAAKYGLFDLIEYFRKRGHYINWIFLAHLGARYSQRKFVKKLVRERIGSGAWMALNFAVNDGDFNAVRYYVEYWGVDPTSKTTITWAIDSGQLEILQYIWGRIGKERDFKYDEPEIRKFVKGCLASIDTTDQYYRDPEARRKCLEFIDDYYKNLFVIN